MKTTTILHSSIRLVFVAGLSLAGWPAARAVGIPIVNASFEMPPVKPGIISNTGIPGWPSPFLLAPGDSLGVANLPAAAFSPLSDGTQMAHVSGRGVDITQVLPVTVQPNTLYVLSADCLTRKVDVGSAGAVILSTGSGLGSVLAFRDCPTTDPNPRVTVSVVTSLNPAQLGQPILINLRCFSGEVFFDNVTLDAIPLEFVLKLGSYLFGLAPHQTARQYVDCLAAMPCSVTLEFHDVHGVLLSQSLLNLQPGETGFLDLPSTAQGREPMEVIPRWWLTEGSADFSLEVFDSEDQRTRFFVNWGDGSVAKTGNLDSGPAAMTRGDTGRLKVYCDGSMRVEGTLRMSPCQANLAFHDVNGRLLKQSQMTLAPGTAGFVDLTFEETRSMDRRVDIVPLLTVTGGPAVGSFALLDSATGRTITQSYPAAVQSVAR